MDSIFPPPFAQNFNQNTRPQVPPQQQTSTQNIAAAVNPTSSVMPESNLTKQAFTGISAKITQIIRQVEELETINRQKEEAKQSFENNLRTSKSLKELFVNNINESNLKSDLKSSLVADTDHIFAKNLEALNENPANIQKKIDTIEQKIDTSLDEIGVEVKEVDPKTVLNQLFSLFTSIQEASGKTAQKTLKVILPVFERYLNSDEIPDLALLKQVVSFLERVGKIDPKGLENQGPIIIDNLYNKFISSKIKLVSEGKLSLDDQKKASLFVAQRLLKTLSREDGVDMYRSILLTIESALR